ncbi:MAG: DUF5336 domain-containing protein [Legionella sp.]|uniref:DUF5336 domain-containing protein n=1 Tax=Legionella sp. TaxID=459 RepID=UPI002843C35E|nr:DUF5336 domain-containing protein [Legionella sp.]
MPKVRKLTGNYIDMLKAIYPVMSSAYASPEACVENFTTASTEISTQLLKDLERDQFLSTNNRTYEEFVAHWMDPAVSVAYNQGNLTSSFFSLLLSMYMLQDPRFEKQKTAKDAPERTDRQEYYHRDKKSDIALGYFDDEGVACGISIDYSLVDPNLWTITIIRNTTAAPEDRQVLLTSSAEMLPAGNKGLVNINDAQKAILDFLKSKTLSQQIKDCGLFAKDGTLNLANVEKLHAQYHTGSYPYSTKIVTKLVQQEMKIKQWQLTEQQFSLVKAALDAKRQKNIEKLDEWYPEWYAKQKENITSPALDVAGKQSFLRRNSSNIFAAVAAAVTLIGFALVLSGVLAPFGIALIGTTELILGAVGAGLAFAATLASAIKMGFNEQRLSAYQTELEHVDSISKEIYNEKLSSITALTAVEQLPEHDAIQTENFRDQLLRAILHVNFSEEEFAELAEQITPALPPVVNQDDELVVDVSFEEQMQLVIEIGTGDESLNRVVDRAIQQEEHAHEIVVQEEYQSDVPQTVEQADSSTLNNLITVR